MLPQNYSSSHRPWVCLRCNRVLNSAASDVAMDVVGKELHGDTAPPCSRCASSREVRRAGVHGRSRGGTRGAKRLRAAATAGDTVQLAQLLVRGVDVNSQTALVGSDSAVQSPFYLACEHGNARAAVLLARCGASTTQHSQSHSFGEFGLPGGGPRTGWDAARPNGKVRAALCELALLGHSALAKEILDKVGVAAFEAVGVRATALCAAAQRLAFAKGTAFARVSKRGLAAIAEDLVWMIGQRLRQYEVDTVAKPSLCRTILRAATREFIAQQNPLGIIATRAARLRLVRTEKALLRHINVEVASKNARAIQEWMAHAPSVEPLCTQYSSHVRRDWCSTPIMNTVGRQNSSIETDNTGKDGDGNSIRASAFESSVPLCWEDI